MVISVAAAVLFIVEHLPQGLGVPDHRGRAVGLHLDRGRHDLSRRSSSASWCSRTSSHASRPYIERNIDGDACRVRARRRSRLKTFDYNTDARPSGDVADNKATLDNVRLWDPPRAQEAFQPTQEFQPFYKFSDVDVDRYKVDGETRCRRSRGVRELDSAQLPEQHVDEPAPRVHARVRRRRRGGQRARTATSPTTCSPTSRRPGELADLNAARRVLRRGPQRLRGRRHQGRRARGERRGPTKATTQYEGDGGVKVSSLAAQGSRSRCGSATSTWSSRASSRASRGSSTSATSSSASRPRRRSCSSTPIRTRSCSTAGSCGCSTATRRPNRYPYSQSINPTVPPGSGLDTDFNYVRNSVKATVDAYDGTVHFYVVDPKDPIIQTYRKAFPELFNDVDGHAGRAAGPLAVPRGHLRRADRAVHAVPHDRPAAVLPEGGAVGRRAEPGRVGSDGTAVDGARRGGNNGGRNTTLASSGTGSIRCT